MDKRTNYRGAVRDSAFEGERDARMAELHQQGVPITALAQRMGLNSAAVRIRIQRVVRREELERALP